jgi:hypothetical protein
VNAKNAKKPCMLLMQTPRYDTRRRRTQTYTRLSLSLPPSTRWRQPHICCAEPPKSLPYHTLRPFSVPVSKAAGSILLRVHIRRQRHTQSAVSRPRLVSSVTQCTYVYQHQRCATSRLHKHPSPGRHEKMSTSTPATQI